VLFGGAPWRAFYEHGAWYVAFIRYPNLRWFVDTFGDVDFALFRALNATGEDTYEGVGFERMK
jgi:hypothetical protein